MTVSGYFKSSYKIWTKSRCLCTLTTALNISKCKHFSCITYFLITIANKSQTFC